MNEETLFHLAQEKPAGERAAFLDQTCAGDAGLRRRVEALLHAHDNPGSFLDKPAVDADLAVAAVRTWDSPGGAVPDRPVAEAAGSRVGPFKLLRQIGEGGMGVVFLAEQSHPVRRKVALKVIKPGMDSRQVIARFEAERQALALMDHPNIARVFDAGTTELGRPYFVMELVKGLPITKYCDEHRLTPRQRLELFMPVCQAVQHAHQKGIIHRDLKPSNVMVALYDGKPVPKVIDFGVAKATGAGLTDRTLFTGYGSILGTLEYMSPEQAELNQLDVDTRSDVYSLGVLLYELLTGSTPLERKRLTAAAMNEALRIIREEEPQKPSTRLSTVDGLPGIAANRGLEPSKLSGTVRGELDWIVMKALEKDRAHRYETANGLGRDIGRYLADEPVHACPPSAAYRLKKLVRRNKLLVGGLAALVAVLAVGVAGTGAGFLRARQQKAEAQGHQKRSEEQAAIAKAVNEFLTDMLSAADPNRMLGDKVTVLQAIEEAIKKLDAGALKDQPLVEAAVRATIGNTLRHLSRYEEAAPHLRKALDTRRSALPADHPDVTASIKMLAGLLYDQGKYREAEPLEREVLAILRRTLPPDHIDITLSIRALGWVLYAQGRMPEAEGLLREALGRHRTRVTLNPVAVLLQATGRSGEAEPLYREALDLSRRELPPGHLALARPTSSLAMVLFATGKLPQAESLQREALAINRKALPVGHRDIASAAFGLALILQDERKLDEAEPLHGEALEIKRKVLPAGHVDIARSLSSTGGLLRLRGKFEEAEQFQRESLAIRRAALPAGHLELAYGLRELAWALEARGKFSEAVPLVREALEIRQKSLPPGSSEIKRTAAHLLSVTRLANGPGGAGAAAAASQAVAAAQSLSDMNTQAWRLRQAGRLVEAADLRGRVVDEARRTNHPELAKFLKGYGEVLELLGRLPDAEARFLEALAVLKQSPDAGAGDTSTLAGLLAKLYRRMNKPEKAAEYDAQTLAAGPTTRALAEAEALLPQKEREASTADDWLSVATTRVTLKHWSQAVSGCARACSIAERAAPLERWTIADRCVLVAKALRSRQRQQEAVQVFKLAIALRRLPDPDAPPAVLLSAGHNYHDMAFDVAAPDEALAAIRSAIEFKGRAAARAPGDGTVHVHLAHSYIGLASLLQRAAAPPDAAKARGNAADALEQAVKELDAEGVADTPEVARVRASVARSLVGLGRPGSAIPLLERARALLVSGLGPGHRESLDCTRSLARARQSAGRHDLALPLFEEALAAQRVTMGAAHAETLAHAGALANAYRSAGQPEKRLSLLEQIAADVNDDRGADHPDTLQHTNTLAVAYWAGGKLDRSVPLFERLLKVYEAKEGKDHPDTRRALANLGVNYRDSGRIDEAVALLEKALYPAGQPDPFPETLDWAARQLIETYERAGSADKAEPLCRALLARAKPHPATRPSGYDGLLARLGTILLRQKKYADAEPVLRECLTLREVKEPHAWTTANARSLLGGALLGQQKYADAEPLLLAGHAGMEQLGIQAPPQVQARRGEALERLVQLYDAWGKPDQAAEWRAKRPPPSTGPASRPASYSATRPANQPATSARTSPARTTPPPP